MLCVPYRAHKRYWHQSTHWPPPVQHKTHFHAERHIIAASGFGAGASKTRPRDDAIGCATERRRRNLHVIVNNVRSLPAAWLVLILPRLHCQNRASRILALTSKPLAEDWHTRYAYRPILLETFVGKPRSPALATRRPTGSISEIPRDAASWTHSIATQSPSRASWVYPLTRDPQQQL